MHRPAQSAGRSVNGPCSVENATRSIVIHPKIHRVAISMVGETQRNDRDSEAQKDIFSGAGHGHAPKSSIEISTELSGGRNSDLWRFTIHRRRIQLGEREEYGGPFTNGAFRPHPPSVPMNDPLDNG